MKRLTRSDKILSCITFVLLLLLVLFTAFSWSNLPNRIPSHFNAAGVADRWGSRGTVWFCPIMGFFTCGTLFVCSFLDDNFINLPFSVTPEEKSFVAAPIRRTLSAVNLECALLFVFLGVGTILGGNISPVLLWSTLAALFLTVGVGCYFSWRRKCKGTGQ